jgi:glutamyl-tRNA synthetase
LGIDFDEGPHVSGEFGPYIQSQRLEIYREHVKTLAEKNLAYPCFCSSERLTAMRDRQAALGVPPMYDRHCRLLPKSDSSEKIQSGEPHVWRMAVPDKRIVQFTDAIREIVEFDAKTIDDQVLLKSDGFPTYHLANVVDDHFMQITHVIRGEEWLPSTPKHILLYEAFGWQPPQFAHLPLLLNADRSKMSKRSGDVAVEEYRNKGFMPQTLINFVALLGWHPQDEREIFSLSDLVKEFSLERVNKAGAVFDLTKLKWMSSEYIKAMSDAELCSKVSPLIHDILSGQDEKKVFYAMQCLRAGAETFGDLAQKIKEIYRPSPLRSAEMIETLRDEKYILLIETFLNKISAIEDFIWTDFIELESRFKTAANESSQMSCLKGKPLWHTLRIALTGQEQGPELAKLVGIWGKHRVLAELNDTVKLISQVAP